MRCQKGMACVVAILMLCFFFLPAKCLAMEEKSEESRLGSVLRQIAEMMPEEAIDIIGRDRIEEMKKGDDADLSLIASVSQWQSLPQLLVNGLKQLLSPFLRVTLGCLCLILFSAISDLFVCGDGRMASAMGLLTSTVLSLFLMQIGQDVLEILENALTTVGVWIKALIPTVVVIYTAGGNFTAAATEEAMLLLIVEWIEVLCKSVLSPLLMTCLLLCIFNGAIGDGRLRGLGAGASKAVIWLLSLMMLIFSTVFASQHTIAAGADSLLLRSVKFVTSGMIPIVGGSLSEMMNTTAGAVGFMRSTVGTLATLAVLALLLGPMLQIGGIRLSMRLSATLAQCFGCAREQGLFDEIGSIFDLAIAILAVCFLAALFAMTLMIRCGVAAASVT